MQTEKSLPFDQPGPDPRIAEAATRARENAPFLALLLDREPALAERFEVGFLDPAPAVPLDMPVGKRLRLERRALALRVAIGDLAGELNLTAVTGALTAFADRALDTAIGAAIAERYPGEAPRGLTAIALGKSTLR